MSKKYKLIPIFNDKKTSESKDLINIENSINILSKTLNKTKFKDLNGSLILMVNKSNGDSLDVQEINKLESVFKNKAIILTGISDLNGYLLEEYDG